MAITLITPAEQWVAGATVQFKFDHYGAATKQSFDLPSQGGWGAYMTGTWAQLLLGARYYTGQAWRTHFLWTLAEINDFLSSATSRTIAASFEVYGAGIVGAYEDPDYFDDVPDAYADFVSATPNYQTDVEWTNTAIGSNEFHFRFTGVYELTVPVGDGIEVRLNSTQNYTVASEAIADAAEAYFAANPPTNTPQGIALYYFNLDGSNIGGPIALSQLPDNAVSVSFKSSDSTASVIEGTSGRDYALPSHEITVTLTLKADLPAGGLYLFVPTCHEDWYATLFPPYEPSLSSAGAAGLVSILSYESLLVNPNPVPEFGDYCELLVPTDGETDIERLLTIVFGLKWDIQEPPENWAQAKIIFEGTEYEPTWEYIGGRWCFTIQAYTKPEWDASTMFTISASINVTDPGAPGGVSDGWVNSENYTFTTAPYPVISNISPVSEATGVGTPDDHSLTMSTPVAWVVTPSDSTTETVRYEMGNDYPSTWDSDLVTGFVGDPGVLSNLIPLSKYWTQIYVDRKGWVTISPPIYFVTGLRADDYNPDFFWSDGEWRELDALAGAGGGRYNRQLVAVGHQVVYVEAYI